MVERNALQPNEYRCAVCKGVFAKGLPDEEAAEELSNTFPGFDTADCDLVCDDCYKRIIGGALKEGE